jgi:hypothetical protein
MKTIGEMTCPSCEGRLVPVELGCGRCGVTVRGRFAENEFASLGEEELHFLRIFVLCEGRIREMESALGVSYPTIKSRLAKLKETLGARGPELAKVEEAPAEGSAMANVLRELDDGEISFEQAMLRIKEIQTEGDL